MRITVAQDRVWNPFAPRNLFAPTPDQSWRDRAARAAVATVLRGSAAFLTAEDIDERFRELEKHRF